MSSIPENSSQVKADARPFVPSASNASTATGSIHFANVQTVPPPYMAPPNVLLATAVLPPSTEEDARCEQHFLATLKKKLSKNKAEMLKTGGGTSKIQELTSAEEILSILLSTIQGLPSIFDGTFGMCGSCTFDFI
ncbi:hypothetical protein ALC60_13773 [Trachymyrmex zeteki]|uniref:Uncharacterized protein n=1 Tax=Mycetomoellerius zeteki TaxID=64791 RepID=A0A151WHA2_9HYME|nr:hypothetical protein ALC60_13773 [Trachymyrmex zeteki]